MNKVYYIYKITNLINDKMYIGQHFGYVNDMYMGSGKIICRAIKRYGLENFAKDILEICTKDTVNNREIYYINKYNSICPNGYNISTGGTGGDTLTNHPNIQQIKQKMKEHHSNFWTGHFHTEETKQKISEHHADFSGSKHPRFGQKLSDKTKQKISEKSKLKKGYRHIYNPLTGEQKCLMHQTDPLPDGFCFGRHSKKDKQ